MRTASVVRRHDNIALRPQKRGCLLGRDTPTGPSLGYSVLQGLMMSYASRLETRWLPRGLRPSAIHFLPSLYFRKHEQVHNLAPKEADPRFQ